MLLVGRQEVLHPACKKLSVGLLVVTIWLELCKFYRSSCHHHHLHYPCSNKIQNIDVWNEWHMISGALCTVCSVLIHDCLYCVSHAYACRARYCFSTSVPLSVTHWYCIENECTCRQTFNHLVEAWLVFESWHVNNIPKGTSSVLALNTDSTWGGKNLGYSTEITVYLGNGTR